MAAGGGGSQEAGDDDDDDDMQSVESNYVYDDGSDDEAQESTQGKVRGLDPHPAVRCVFSASFHPCNSPDTLALSLNEHRLVRRVLLRPARGPRASPGVAPWCCDHVASAGKA